VTADPGYSHTQKAPPCLILPGPALLCFGPDWKVGSGLDQSHKKAVGAELAAEDVKSLQGMQCSPAAHFLKCNWEQT
jgi:hypothetical protein